MITAYVSASGRCTLSLAKIACHVFDFGEVCLTHSMNKAKAPLLNPKAALRPFILCPGARVFCPVILDPKPLSSEILGPQPLSPKVLDAKPVKTCIGGSTKRSNSDRSNLMALASECQVGVSRSSSCLISEPDLCFGKPLRDGKAQVVSGLNLNMSVRCVGLNDHTTLCLCICIHTYLFFFFFNSVRM